MNAYRFAREQRKPVATFEDDQADDTSGNRLIMEDAAAARTLAERRDAWFPRTPAETGWQEWLRQVSSST